MDYDNLGLIPVLSNELCLGQQVVNLRALGELCS